MGALGKPVQFAIIDLPDTNTGSSQHGGLLYNGNYGSPIHYRGYRQYADNVCRKGLVSQNVPAVASKLT